MEKHAYQVAEDSEIEGLWWVLSASGTMENFPNEKLAREWAQRMEKNAALERDHVRWEESKKQLLDTLEGGGFVYLAGPGMTASGFRDQARHIESPISFHGPHRHGMTVAEARKVDKLRLTAAAMDARSGRDRHGVGLWFDVERHGTKRLKNRLVQEGHNLSSAMPPYYYGHLEYLEALESKD